MRLSARSAAIIAELARKHFGADSSVYLFGSRTHDALRGGDIDLYIEVPQELGEKFRIEKAFSAELQRALGEQKIDVIVRDGQSALLPIHLEARNNGVRI